MKTKNSTWRLVEIRKRKTTIKQLLFVINVAPRK